MHGTGVFALRPSLCQGVRGSSVLLGLQILLRRGAELGGAALAAKVDGDAVMVKASRLGAINLHPTYGIVHLRFLHGLIVGLFAQFDLCVSALSAQITDG
jgi:hypothetical protein